MFNITDWTADTAFIELVITCDVVLLWLCHGYRCYKVHFYTLPPEYVLMYKNKPEHLDDKEQGERETQLCQPRDSVVKIFEIFVENKNEC